MLGCMLLIALTIVLVGFLNCIIAHSFYERHEPGVYFMINGSLLIVFMVTYISVRDSMRTDLVESGHAEWVVVDSSGRVKWKMKP